MKSPSVSIIMSLYRSKITHLRLALESILKQSLTDWELLIMVDGKKGNASVLKVLKEYASKDRRIKIFSRKENLGLTKSLNELIKLASGTYIARMDGDDESLPTRLEKQFAFMKQHKNVAVCGSNCEFVDGQGNHLYFGKQRRVSDAKNLLSKGNFLVHSTLFMRSSVLKKFLYNENFRYAQDFELLLRIAEKYKIDLIEEPLLRYRRDEEGISYAKISEQNKAACAALEQAVRDHHYGMKARFYAKIWSLFARFPAFFRLARNLSLLGKKPRSRPDPITLIVKPSKKIGGPTTFIGNLVSGLKGKVSISNQVSRPAKGRAVMLVVVQDNPWRLLKAKMQGIPIIQRLDGLFYQAPLKERLINLYVKFIRDVLATHVIYQSQFSKAFTDLIIGSTKTPYSFVMNGVDEKIFNRNNQFNPYHPVFVMTGNFRHRGMLNPIIGSLDILKKEGLEFTLKVIGPVASHVSDLLNKPYIIHIQGVPNNKLGALLADTDIYLFAQRNSACPNALIEAVVAGIPIVSYDSGGAKEIMGSAGVLVKTKNVLVHEDKDFKPAPFVEGIKTVMKNYDHYLAASKVERQRLLISSMADNYLDVFKRI